MSLIKLDAYEKELSRFASDIRHYLEYKGVPPDLAFDIVQDVLVKLIESELVLPLNKIRAWMYRVAMRRYIDYYRRDRHYRELLKEVSRQKEENCSFMPRDYAPLYDVLSDLPQKYRQVLDLYYFQELSVKEVALLLDSSVSKVKVDLMRGRHQAAKLLEKKGYTNEDFRFF